MPTILEKMSAWEQKRATTINAMKEIMEKADADGVNLDVEQQEQYDEYQADLNAIEQQIKNYKVLADADKASAKPVNGKTEKGADESRSGIISVKRNLPKGTAFTRYAIALARSKGNMMQAEQIAKQWDDTPEVASVLKAAVAAGTTTDPAWAAPLVDYTNLTSEFIELLRPETILGRITGLRQVPFNVKMPGQTSGSTVNWVGQGKAKPVSALAFNSTSLGMAKCAGIVVLTDELVRSSNPSAEAVVQGDLIAAIAEFLDTAFIDPSKTAVADVSPASVTNGVTAIPASGTDLTAVIADVKAVFKAYLTANMTPKNGVWVMSETTALALSLMTNPLGQPAFPDITMTGGIFYGMPVITSSLAADNLVLINAGDVFLADDGQVMLDASKDASVEMSDTPDGTGTIVSLWQNNMTGIRAERFINWKKRRAQAVQYISGVNYGSVESGS